MQRGEQQPDRDADRLLRVVVLFPAIAVQAVDLREDDDDVRRVLDVGLAPVGADGIERAQPLS